MNASAPQSGTASSSQPITLRGCRTTITAPAIADATKAANATSVNRSLWRRLACSTMSAARKSASTADSVTTSTLARQVSTWITRLLLAGGRNDSLSPGALLGSAKERGLARQQSGSRHRLQRRHRQSAAHRGAVPGLGLDLQVPAERGHPVGHALQPDRKSTRLNSSHSQISYAVFCLKKKNIYVRYCPPRDNDA